jgi:hypothetical protein
MVFKALLIVIIIAILMEDGSSIQKTEEEKREEKELAELVNRTLAEEKKKEDEEKRREDKKKRKTEDEIKGKIEDTDEKKEVEDKNEACPPANISCPIMRSCQPCEDCPRCPDCPRCGQCPEIQPCDPCGPCPPVKPCKPCEQVNTTDLPPTNNTCPEGPGMSVPMALAVGACAGGLLTGVAALLGLLLRYFSPLECGFLFLATIIIVWYLCSHYPETARELGGRAVAILREAAVALGHRVMEAIRHHQEQVGVPTKPNLFFRMSSVFHL